MNTNIIDFIFIFIILNIYSLVINNTSSPDNFITILFFPIIFSLIILFIQAI